VERAHKPPNSHSKVESTDVVYDVDVVSVALR